MDTKVAIMMMMLVGLQIVREILGLYKDAQHAEEGEDDDATE